MREEMGAKINKIHKHRSVTSLTAATALPLNQVAAWDGGHLCTEVLEMLPPSVLFFRTVINMKV